jgi:hypothetical protein
MVVTVIFTICEIRKEPGAISTPGLGFVLLSALNSWYSQA